MKILNISISYAEIVVRFRQKIICVSFFPFFSFFTNMSFTFTHAVRVNFDFNFYPVIYVQIYVFFFITVFLIHISLLQKSKV